MAKDGEIIDQIMVDTRGEGHAALADLLAFLKIDALICGGIGPGAQMALADKDVTVYGGVTGLADAAAAALARGELVYDPDARCDHHEHEDGHDCAHGAGHCCGHHGPGHQVH